MRPAKDFLAEIGTEELPPKALKGLMLAFANNVEENLRQQRLSFSDIHAYASPRRLAVVVFELASSQEDQEVHSKGPPVSIAFGGDGKPTPAGLAFAKKCGVAIDELARETTDKGEWLSHRSIEKGISAAELLPGCINAALEALPISRRMRWGNSDIEFVRPVHWVVLLHGKTTVPGEVLGISAGNQSQGHRFLAAGPLTINDAGSYLSVLERKGFVLADFAARQSRIEKDVAAAAADCGGVAVGSDSLFEEVTALNEWPVAVAGQFDASFLSLPREVISATLTDHQRYFCVAGADGELLPAFVAVSNIVSKNPEQVRLGNERVIRPRLADAAFFWAADQRDPLDAWRPSLKDVVYQRGLGSMHDKSARVAKIAAVAAKTLGADVNAVKRAAVLAKCDLLSDMVGEFPELQGIMGHYYAQASGESVAVAEAIGEQYKPRFAGDKLPVSTAGCCLAVADKLDTLCGIFALGKKPSGNRDPFGLRRGALGLVRILIERRLDLDLDALIVQAVSLQKPAGKNDVAADVYDFIVDRMLAYYRDEGNISPEMFAAVREQRPSSLVDFDARVQAVASFVLLDSAASLAAANKRIANILRKAEYAVGAALDPTLLGVGAERDLYTALGAARDDVGPLLSERRYSEVLTRLAELRQSVDAFFDDVMVMTDDDVLRLNRLTLLSELRAQFLNVADVSRLSIGKG